jgi:lambda family phage tail tape measure protein
MSNEATILRIRAQVENLEGLNRARSAVRNFATESKAASNDLGKLRGMFKELGAESLRSVNNLKNYRAGLDALRQSAEIGSTTFNELTLEIKQLDGELGALQGKQNAVTQGFNRITRATNAAAAAQRSYNGLIRNPMTGAYSMPPVQTPQVAGLLPPARSFDWTGSDERVQAQIAGQQARTAREARRAQKMQGMANYYGTDIGTRDPATGAMIAGGYQAGPFPALPTQAAPSRFGLTQRQAGGRMNFGSAARGLGAVAAGGVFGGPEGAAGGLIGLGLGGPAGAAAGAAIGATVGMLRQALGATAAYAAELEKQRIALRQVIGSQDAYNKSLEFIGKTSADLAIPQDIVLKNFTRLSASVIGAGGNVADAEKAFKGITAGILGTGGSLENLDAALLATAQVFSKGKVSAEELRGQIGERLPGAFTLFAESVKMTPQQLDKALQEGKVTLLDFQKFAEKLFKEYGQAAELIARSPENAGNRLKTTLANLSESVGTLLKPIGTAFQNTFADIFKIIDAAVRKLNEFLKIDEKGRRATLTARIATTEKEIATGQGYLNLKPSKTGAAYVGLNRSQIASGIKNQQAELQAYKVELAGLNAKPRQEGAGLGAAGAGAGSKKAKKDKKELVDLTKSELQLIQAINRETLAGRTVQAAFFQRNLDYEQTTIAFNSKKIGVNAKQAAFDEAEKKVRQTIAGIFKGYGAELMDQLDTQKSYNQVLDDLANKSRYISEEEQKRLDVARQLKEIIEQYLTILGTGAANAEELKRKLQEALEKAAGFKLTVGEQVVKSLKDAYKSATDLGTSLSSVAVNGVNGIADAFTELALTGKASFADLARSILADLTKIFVKMAVFKFFDFAFPGLGLSKSANGNVFAQNGIQKFAMGGVVNRPTIFPFANGTGLMGEAGPEAIMPLQRAANGKLGVIASGGGTTNVVVNVDASGTSVEGDQAQAKQLGVAVSAAVQAELVKQQRPGGLLAGTRR